jgi:hypothetical protein
MATPSGEHIPSPSLNGVPIARAQRDLTACMVAAVAGELTGGHWLGQREPADPIASYQAVIAVPGLYRALENGLSTWVVGKGPSGQLVSCSFPQDPGNPSGREAWLGTVAGRPHPCGITVEYRTGGLGTADLDGTATQVYATTLIGRHSAGINRVTAHYEDQDEREGVLSEGVWMIQVLRGPSEGPMLLHGYDVDGRLVAKRALS